MAIAIYADDQVVFLNADEGMVTGRIDVFDEPYGVASHPAGTSLFVTLDYPGSILEIDVTTSRIVREIPAGNFLRGLAISPDGRQLYATEYYSGAVVAVDLKTGAIVDQWPGISNDNLARQIVLHPNRPKAYCIPHSLAGHGRARRGIHFSLRVGHQYGDRRAVDRANEPPSSHPHGFVSRSAGDGQPLGLRSFTGWSAILCRVRRHR